MRAVRLLAVVTTLLSTPFPALAQRPAPGPRQSIKISNIDGANKDATPDEAALVAKLGPATQESLPASAGHTPYLAVVSGDARVVHEARCSSGQRRGDGVALRSTGSEYIVTFTCRGASFDGKGSGPATSGSFSVVMKKGPTGPLAPGAGPRQLTPQDAMLVGNTSRAWAELRECIDAFSKYRNDAAVGTFHYRLIGDYGRCSTDMGFKVVQTSGATASQSGALAELLSTKDIARIGYAVSKGDLGIDYNPMVWRADLPDSFDFEVVTSGYPRFKAIQLAAYGGLEPKVGCGNWESLAGGAVSPRLPISGTRKANPDEVNALGLASVPSPMVSIAKVSAATFDTFAKQKGWSGKRFYVRAIPAAQPSGSLDIHMAGTCVGLPSPPMEVHFEPPPPMGDIVGAAQRQMAAKAQAEKLAAAARNALLGNAPGSRAPLHVELTGWEPPFGLGFGETNFLMTAIPDPQGKPIPPVALASVNGPRKTEFTLDQASGGDLVWPSRSGWTEGCVFEPYYFVQAAQHKAHPSSVLGWIGATLNQYAALYKMLQSFVVEGFAYLTTGGACPFNDPTKPGSDTGACKAYKTVARTALQKGMAAVGLPPELPSTNDVAGLGADYLASTAVDAVAGADVSGFVPDSVRQKATASLSDAIKKEALGSTCAQPLKPGDDPHQYGYDTVDPVTMCGIKNGSPFNFARRNTWALGHPTHAVAWLRITKNPGGVQVDPHVKVSVSAAFTGNVVMPKGVASATALTPFGSSNSLQLDVRNVPEKGLLVPVVLPYDEMQWQNIIQRSSAVCGDDAFRPQCVHDNALAAWSAVLRKQPAHIAANVTYTWTENPAQTTSCVGFKDAFGKPQQVCGMADTSVTAEASVLNGPAGRTFEGKTAGMPDYHPCPGFKLAPPDAATGVQSGFVSPDFDMDHL